MFSPARSRKKPRRAGLTGVFVTLFLLGMSLLFIAIFVFPPWRARLSGVETQGTVVSISACPESSDSGGDTVLHTQVHFDDNVEPTIQFTDISGHTDQTQYDICGSYNVGETLTIWYVPSDPGSIFVPDDTGLLIFLTLGLGGLGVVSLLLLLWFSGRVLFVLATGGQIGSRPASSAPTLVGERQIVVQQGNIGVYPAGALLGVNGFPTSVNHPIGQPKTVEGHWSVVPTNAVPSQGDGRTSAVPGRYFALLTITLRNISQEPRYPSQTMFRLYDVMGTEYTRVQALESPLPGSVQPGGTAALTLAFDVPSMQRQFQLNAVSSSTFMTEATWDIAL